MVRKKDKRKAWQKKILPILRLGKRLKYMIQAIKQPTIEATNNINKKEQSFKGPVIGLLRGINQNPALGACAVDLCSMVIPRTAIEFKNRGTQAGIEAAFREGASCIIHACVGLIGLAAGCLVSGKFNQTNSIKAQNIFANADTIANMAEVWKKSGGTSEQFFTAFLENIKGLNGENWKTISAEVNGSVKGNLVKLAEKTAQLSSTNGSEKSKLLSEIKNLKNLVNAQIIKDTGAQASFRLNSIKDEAGNVLNKGVSASLGELIDNAVLLSNSFKTKTKEKLPEFVKALSKNKIQTTLIGLGISALLCMGVQPLNRYLTKKRTGQDGFVGVENKKANNSKGFKFLKTAFGVAFPIFAISTIGNPKSLISNVQFNSKIPSINQFKFLYGLTIGSRFLAARDQNELRESVIKDTLGFTNWLILGGVVSKLIARGIGGKDLINNPVAQTGKKGLLYAWNWLTKTSVKSYDEVLMPAAKNIVENGKMIKFSQLFKVADKDIKSKIFKIAGSQIAGYLYSGLVLGVGIAKLNIFITKQIEARRKEGKKMADKVNGNEKLDIEYLAQMQNKLSSVFKEFNN